MERAGAVGDGEIVRGVALSEDGVGSLVDLHEREGGVVVFGVGLGVGLLAIGLLGVESLEGRALGAGGVDALFAGGVEAAFFH